MAGQMSKSEILAELGRLGELPPKEWTKMECQLRMEELRVELGLHPNPKAKNVTPLRKLMIQLNQASQKKDRLIQFCQQIQVAVQSNDTIPALQKKATLKIYDQAQSSPEDPVGFGKHAAKTYQEVALHEKAYAQWVLQTHQEGECDPRLARLAKWLLQQEQQLKQSDANMMKPEPATSSQTSFTMEDMIQAVYKLKKSPAKSWSSVTSKSVSSADLAATNQNLETLMKTMIALHAGGSEGTEITCGLTPQEVTHRQVRGGRCLGASDADDDDPGHHGLSALSDETLAERSPCSKSDHQGCSLHPLKPSDAKRLEQSSRSAVPQLVRDLVGQNRMYLLEVACSPDSILTSVMQETTASEGSAMRLSVWNQHDLTTNAGIHAVLDKIDLRNPEHVWVSPDCGPYSVMQNINQRTDEQKESLQAKRREALKQYVGCAVIVHYCIQRGTHVTWELSQSCLAWRLPLIQKLAKKYELRFGIVRGCQVNLRDPKGRFINKGWKIMTTHPLMSQRLDLPCTCEKGTDHVACEGSLTRKTAFYTKEFAQRVCQTIIQHTTKEGMIQELQGYHDLGPNFGHGKLCVCDELRVHDAQVTCGACQNMTSHETHEHGLVSKEQKKSHCELTPEEIQKKLYLLHSSTGHGPIRHLIQMLKRRVVEELMNMFLKRLKTSHVLCAKKGLNQSHETWRRSSRCHPNSPL